MLNAAIALMAALLVQQAGGTAPADIPVLKAGLGSCSADFTVRAEDGSPVYAALIHVKIRYGVMSMKRMDLEISTNPEGKARVEGLPKKAKPMAYDIQKSGRKASVQQNVASSCLASYEVAIK